MSCTSFCKCSGPTRLQKSPNPAGVPAAREVGEEWLEGVGDIRERDLVEQAARAPGMPSVARSARASRSGRSGVAQARTQQLGPERRAVGGDELAGKPRRRGDGNLLAEDGAHGKLEAVPGARHAEAGPRGDQRRHHRVFGELGADGERIGGEIEDPSEACQVPNEPAPSRVDEVKASLGR